MSLAAFTSCSPPAHGDRCMLCCREFVVQLEGVGLSVVAPTQELLYARLAGIQARVTQSKARRTLEAAVRHIQADNTLASASYPVRASIPLLWQHNRPL